MLAPMTHQLNDMKVLYENSKATSTDIGGKIDELKRVLSMQGDFYTRGGPTGVSAQQQSMDLMDPQIVKKGIEDIKEQMRDMQKEAVNIENDLERRFHAMQTKTQQ